MMFCNDKVRPISLRKSFLISASNWGFEEIPSSLNLDQLARRSLAQVTPHFDHLLLLPLGQLLHGLHLLSWRSSSPRRTTTPSLLAGREHQVEVVAHVLVQVGHQIVVVAEVEVYL